LTNMTVHCTYVVYIGLLLHPMSCFNPCKDLLNVVLKKLKLKKVQKAMVTRNCSIKIYHVI
jgi:hypothetical protein